MKNLDDLKNDLKKVHKDFIQKCVNDIIDKHLGRHTTIIIFER